MAIAAAPRLCAHLVDEHGLLLPVAEKWTDTVVRLPGELAGMTYLDVLTSTKVTIEEGDGEASLPVNALLRDFPVALLTACG